MEAPWSHPDAFGRSWRQRGESNASQVRQLVESILGVSGTVFYASSFSQGNVACNGKPTVGSASKAQHHSYWHLLVLPMLLYILLLFLLRLNNLIVSIHMDCLLFNRPGLLTSCIPVSTSTWEVNKPDRFPDWYLLHRAGGCVESRESSCAIPRG